MFLVCVGRCGYKVDCKSSASPAVKREVKPIPVTFPEAAHCPFGADKTATQPRRAAPDVPSGPPRKWKHRHINRHFSSTSDNHPETGRHVAERTVKAYQSPSWLVAEQPVPLSAVCHQGLPVIKKGSPVPPAPVLPNDLSRRFLVESSDHDLERSAMLRKRRLDDRRDVVPPFAMSPNVPKFPAFNYGINPVDIPAGYLSVLSVK